MPYVPLTEAEAVEMLEAVGVKSMDELWLKAIGSEPQPDLSGLPQGRSEFEVTSLLGKLAARNATGLTCFLGGGFYDHFIPAAVDEVISRSEFYTAYTPYQPETSQGTLQAIFEYQSLICRLTGMQASNASMYDGGTALFEAIMMSVRINRKSRAVVLGSVSPIYRHMLDCYSSNLDVELAVTPDWEKADLAALAEFITPETGCLVVQYPNAFGVIEDLKALTDLCKERKIVSICSVYPTALGMLEPPGSFGFDIVVGEGQPLGIPLSFGGPYLGFMATTEKHVRKMPGRIAGRTEDLNGDVGYVLTLQAREQHIRREKATSNICTNEGLCALAATAYMTCIGKNGFVQVAELCAAKAKYCHDMLTSIDGVEGLGLPFFNEFVVNLPIDASEVAGKLIQKGYAAGFPLGRYFPGRENQLLVAVTEKRTREEIKGLAVALEAVLADLT